MLFVVNGFSLFAVLFVWLILMLLWSQRGRR